MLKFEIDTPALLIDLDLMDRNIETLAKFFKGKKGKSFRPHFKTPKTPIIAWKEIRSGANGICCQKLEAAEVLVAAGINDVLITNEVVGDYKIKKLIGLIKHAPKLMVCIDNILNARALSEEALRKGVKLGVIVDVNAGQNRCGVEPNKPTVEFTKEILRLKGLYFKGIQTYNGLLQQLDQLKGMEAKIEGCKLSDKLTVETKEALEDNGISVEIVTGAGTGTYKLQYNVLSEVQPGSYPLMDWKYYISAPEFHRALTILTTVMSTPAKDRVITDSGSKAASTDAGQPILKDVKGVEFQVAGDEHGMLTLKNPDKEIKLGDKLELFPSHCCTTINLYDKFYGIRDEEVEVIWDIVARGKNK